MTEHNEQSGNIAVPTPFDNMDPIDNLMHSILPRLVQELTMIRKNLSESGREIRFVSSPAIYREIEDRLNKGCQMLHFTGHGCKEGLGFEADEAKRCGVLEPLTVSIEKIFRFQVACITLLNQRSSITLGQYRPSTRILVL